MRLVALAALLALGCARHRADAGAPGPRVVVETASGGRATVRVELARTEQEREQGLMFRRSLPDDAGMLFFFEESEDHAFWMRNTFIPLDMIFVDDGGRIVGIVERATPHSDDPRGVGAPSRYVLEVNGGWASAHGVAKGDRVNFEF